MWPLIILGGLVLMGSKPATAQQAPPQSTPPQTQPNQSTGQIVADVVAVGVSLVEMFKALMDKK